MHRNEISMWFCIYCIVHKKLVSLNGVVHYHGFKVGVIYYEGWNFNSGNYLFTTDTK